MGMVQKPLTRPSVENRKKARSVNLPGPCGVFRKGFLEKRKMAGEVNLSGPCGVFPRGVHQGPWRPGWAGMVRRGRARRSRGGGSSCGRGQGAPQGPVAAPDAVRVGEGRAAAGLGACLTSGSSVAVQGGVRGAAPRAARHPPVLAGRAGQGSAGAAMGAANAVAHQSSSQRKRRSSRQQAPR